MRSPRTGCTLLSEVHLDILTPALLDNLWHRMRSDLINYAPELARSDKLLCCCCFRQLSQSDFSVEHIIPRQVVENDPPEVKEKLTRNERSKTILLCKKPLLIGGRPVRANGCNGWKGAYYDTQLRQVLGDSFLTDSARKPTTQHTIAALCVGYMALVERFGYQVALTESGLLMRRQFFMLRRYHRDMPGRSQMMLLGGPPVYHSEDDLRFWSNPISFQFERDGCFLVLRNVPMVIPMSRDPTTPIAKHIRLVPQRYILRPDFRTLFD
jgi:hypothetical protein